jgi:DNA-binding GntR family transcriptional regulator
LARSARKIQNQSSDAPEPAGTLGEGLAGFQIERVQRVADQVYRSLRRSIVMGELKPGSRLREVEVAAALKVSRTPVREAVSRLIGDCLVRELPTGGVEVVDSTAELFEIYHIREALEGCAARLAAMRINEMQLSKLTALINAAETLPYNAFDRRAEINHEFHMAIAEMAGSRRLLEMISGFREFFMNADWLARYDQKSAKRALQDHRDIVAALRAGAVDRADRLVRQHLKAAYEKLLSERRSSKS